MCHRKHRAGSPGPADRSSWTDRVYNGQPRQSGFPRLRQWICCTFWQGQRARRLRGELDKSEICRINFPFHQIDLNQAVNSGSIAWTGAGTWTPESQNTICVDFYGEDNQNYCCQLGQALTSADGFKPLSNCHPV